MTAALLETLATAGVRVRLGAPGKLKLSGDQSAIDRFIPEIRAHKAELLARLAANADPLPLTQDQRDSIREAITERAAIQEYDGGLSRSEAENQATRAMRVYRYCLTDKPTDWLVMIAPGCDLDEARRTLVGQFGAGRLIDVRESAS
ncbi:hypothetical protein CCR95_14305 [Thiocystis minor]|uniref:hypothetical protein n=1 Tax=Thiocystis minor TaxID=61597 RepID=UPI0019147A20|nr:hypothetical protein [Thiocystis minor]MBK5965228.1 hypothetical protein [Thiocystis minor]